MRENLFYTLILIGLFPFLLIGQETVISGKVYDKVSKEPLPFVNIAFKGTKIGTTTDIDGNYNIATYYASDTLLASFMGYSVRSFYVKKDAVQVIDFPMETSSVQMEEFVVRNTGNPAEKILKNIIRNKKANNKKKYDSYSYEVYNKLEFDINNISDEFKNRKVFKKIDFIFDNLDSTDEKPYLPIMLIESLSDYYYRRAPKDKKEIVKATKVSGVNNQSISQFTGDMYQQVNLYDNYVQVFGKSFVSPIADFGLRFYKYYLEDSMMVDNSYCYKIKFEPRRKQEPTFEGTMFVNDTTFAIKTIEGKIGEGANINFINEFRVRQEFEHVEGKYWMPKKDELVVDFNISERTTGIYGRKTTTYRGIKVNNFIDDAVFAGIEDVEVADDTQDKSAEFWKNNRHEKLSDNEEEIYQMVDSLKKVPVFRSMVDVITMATTGYLKWGKLEVGPIAKTYSNNRVEGHRFRLGGRTSNDFSQTIEFSGYLAYGVKDDKFKYGVGSRWLLNDKPRRLLTVNHQDDVEQLGQNQTAFNQDNILATLFRIAPPNNLTRTLRYKASLENDWIQGLTSKLTLQYRKMKPLGNLIYRSYDVVQDAPNNVSAISTFEASIFTRFAYREKFVSGAFSRVSLGSKYPVIGVLFTKGIKGFVESGYDYEKLELSVFDRIPLGTFGYTRMQYTVGKIWGALPYPLLQLHQGNETYFYDRYSFNMMRYFEFISDKWLTASIYHHFDGYILNKFPLLRKLKWRTVATCRAVYGSIEPKHHGVLFLPKETKRFGHIPYVESSVGIENIFKVFRIDALFRLTHLEQDVKPFGVRGSLSINF